MEFSSTTTPVELRKMIKVDPYLLCIASVDNKHQIGCVIHSWKEFAVCLINNVRLLENDEIWSELSDQYYDQLYVPSEKYIEVFEDIKNKLFTLDTSKDKLKSIENCQIELENYLKVFFYDKKNKKWIMCRRENERYTQIELSGLKIIT